MNIQEHESRVLNVLKTECCNDREGLCQKSEVGAWGRISCFVFFFFYLYFRLELGRGSKDLDVT